MLFFSLKIFVVFDWMQNIVGVAGALRNTMVPSHNPFQIWGQYHKKKNSNLCLGSFPKRIFADSKRTHGDFSKLYYGSYDVKYCILLSKIYNTFYPEKKCLHFALPATLPYLCVPKSLLGLSRSREPIQNYIHNRIPMYKYFCISIKRRNNTWTHACTDTHMNTHC